MSERSAIVRKSGADTPLEDVPALHRTSRLPVGKPASLSLSRACRCPGLGYGFSKRAGITLPEIARHRTPSPCCTCNRHDTLSQPSQTTPNRATCHGGDAFDLLARMSVARLFRGFPAATRGNKRGRVRLRHLGCRGGVARRGKKPPEFARSRQHPPILPAR